MLRNHFLESLSRAYCYVEIVAGVVLTLLVGNLGLDGGPEVELLAEGRGGDVGGVPAKLIVGRRRFCCLCNTKN